MGDPIKYFFEKLHTLTGSELRCTGSWTSAREPFSYSRRIIYIKGTGSLEGYE